MPDPGSVPTPSSREEAQKRVDRTGAFRAELEDLDREGGRRLEPWVLEVRSPGP